MNEHDKRAWEQQLDEPSQEILRVQDTLTCAQEFQVNIAQLPRDMKLDAGIEALRIIASMQPDVRHQKFAIRAIRSYAYFEHLRKSEDDEMPMLSFDSMLVGGQVGYYTYAHFDNEETLSLQLFEPRQFSVARKQDEILAKRFPVPLSIPVLCIESLIRLP
jgi:hypothetical protein